MILVFNRELFWIRNAGKRRKNSKFNEIWEIMVWSIEYYGIEYFKAQSYLLNHSNLNSTYISDFNDAILSNIHSVLAKRGLFEIFYLGSKFSTILLELRQLAMTLNELVDDVKWLKFRTITKTNRTINNFKAFFFEVYKNLSYLPFQWEKKILLDILINSSFQFISMKFYKNKKMIRKWEKYNVADLDFRCITTESCWELVRSAQSAFLS